ncbi:MAG TPA: prepilin-type N-terminal cleavage/methylation domain-containing protein, partial [Telluria sp.]
MKSMKRAAQAGFTLIELIVVIVILGILAATA